MPLFISIVSPALYSDTAPTPYVEISAFWLTLAQVLENNPLNGGPEESRTPDLSHAMGAL